MVFDEQLERRYVLPEAVEGSSREDQAWFSHVEVSSHDEVDSISTGRVSTYGHDAG